MKKFIVFFAILLIFTVFLVGFKEFVRNVALAVTIAAVLRMANEVLDE